MGDEVQFVGLNSRDDRTEATQAGAQDRRHLRPPVRPRRPTFVADVGVAVAAQHAVRRRATASSWRRKTGTMNADQLRSKLHGAVRRVIDGAFAYAFTAGMVATVNPCGFAMLPAYLSYFLGLEGQAADRSTAARARPRPRRQRRTVTVGFVLVFVGIGARRERRPPAGRSTTPSTSPSSIGLALVGLGVAMLLGYRLPFTTPRLDKGGREPHGRLDVRVRRLLRRRLDRLHAAALHRRRPRPASPPAARSSGVLGVVLTYGARHGPRAHRADRHAGPGATAVCCAGLRRAMPYVDRVAGVFLVLAGALPRLLLDLQPPLRRAPARRTGGGLARTGGGRSFDTQTWLAGPRRLGARHAAGRRAARRHRRAVVARPAAGSAPTVVVRGDATDVPPDARRAARPPRRRGGARAAVRFGFMAFHGGSLEEMTDVIARGRGRAGRARRYYGVHQPQDLQWHLPSTAIDPAASPALAAFLDHVDVVVTVHGYGREGYWATLLLGGQNRAAGRPRGRPPAGRACRPTRSPPTWSGSRSRCGACTPATR